MREKLERLGLELPLLPTTTVGSFPKPPYILEARRKFATKKLAAEELNKLEKQATREWMEFQEKVGLDVLVDGEMYRGDMATHFANNLDGFKISGLVRSYGNRYYRKPIIAGEVKWRGPITVDWWRFTQELTSKPVKGMITGPYTMMDWSFNEYYPSRREACLALAKVLHEEVKALAKAGAKIIQVDEPAISARPEELSEFAIEAMQVVTKGVDAYFINHICYGAFEFIYPEMLELPVDNFDLEMSNSEFDLVELFREHPFTKDLSFGVVDVHSHVVENTAMVEQRIRRALEVLKPEQLWIDPDCGLKTRTSEEAANKLKALVKAAQNTRAQL
ncbi:5-methyltetrahydropteroyltriglutamate--homocysteine methyltransferase [subsurface metagenome]|nr:methionine synthase [Hadesarchaea archaeon]